MQYPFSPRLLSLLVSLALTPLAQAASSSATSLASIERITIFGGKGVNQIPGSAHSLSSEDLETFAFSDIMRTLTSVPGVYVLEEDGYGLRPNIGMRGTGQNRSEKVTIMEDNVLAAPAPYAAPSAYYFPTAGRMQQIEVLKGTSSAMYGPRTTGGVVNMLSRQIPTEPLAGQLSAQSGQDGFAKLHGFIGGQGETFGSLFEAYRYQADGFKHIAHSDRDTGFVKNDVLAKVNYIYDLGVEQVLELKLKYSDEDSNESYMGLTEQDYLASPFIRYSASQKDNMTTDHQQMQLNHFAELTPSLSISSSLYRNEFNRNWYKTSKINGSSLGKGGIDIAAAFDLEPSGNALSVDVKANNRAYLSEGIQTQLEADLNAHQLSLGLRLHRDEMDRFQWVDGYRLDANYQMTLSEAGIAGTDSNRIDSAEALALFIHDEWTLGKAVLHLGLRYEDMRIERKDWGKSDPERQGQAKHKRNELDVFLPSLALTYKLNEHLVLLGGLQKGFAPPAPGNPDAENEESINYELGARVNKEEFSGEALLFLSDYDNMHGNCTASQNCDDSNIGQQYNAGEVKVQGLELKLDYSFAWSTFTLPIGFTYTYTHTEFVNSFDSDFWGEVTSGDELPYVPEQQAQISLGLQSQEWRTDLLLRHTSETRTQAGTGYSEETLSSKTLIDWVAKYQVATGHEISIAIDNLLDETYMASRTHGSIMVGKPRSLNIGYTYRF